MLCIIANISAICQRNLNAFVVYCQPKYYSRNSLTISKSVSIFLRHKIKSKSYILTRLKNLFCFFLIYSFENISIIKKVRCLIIICFSLRNDEMVKKIFLIRWTDTYKYMRNNMVKLSKNCEKCKFLKPKLL